MVLAPESELVEQLTTKDQKEAVDEYITQAHKKTELERMTDKKVSGVFTGSYARHPFTQEPIPIWISDYVLAGYGTGAIMAVPAHDSRDYAFAKHFNLPIIPLVEVRCIRREFRCQEGIMINSDFLNGLPVESYWQSNRRNQQTRVGLQPNKLPSSRCHFLTPTLLGRTVPNILQRRHATHIKRWRATLELPPVDKFLPTETGQPP